MRRLFVSVSVLALVALIVSLSVLMKNTQAAACGNPLIYNEFGVPVNYYGGIISVNANDFPRDASGIIQYPLKIKNSNAQAISLSVTPSSSLKNIVFPLQINMTAGQDKTAFNLNVDVRKAKAGTLTLGGSCENGLPLPEGVINFVIKTEVNEPVQQCKGTLLSCGLDPDKCQDLRNLNGCYNGIYRKYSCNSNNPTYVESCSDFCCREAYGTKSACKSVGGVRSCSGSVSSVSLNITNGKVAKTLKVDLLSPDTANVLSSLTINGTGSLSTSSPKVDFKAMFDDDKFIFTLKNTTVSSLGSKANLKIDSASPSLSTLSVYRAFYVELPSGIEFSKISLKIKYRDLSFRNQNQLSLYKCSSFNLDTNICTSEWSKITSTFDGDYVTANVTSFSAYLVGEPATSTTTTQPSGGGGSGGGSSGGSSGSSSSSSTTSSRKSSSGGGGLTVTKASESDTTGFADFPKSAEVEAGSSVTVSGKFTTRHKPSLDNLVFAAKGISTSWYSFDPEKIDSLPYGESKAVSLKINVPEDAAAKTYAVTLQASTSSSAITYEKSVDLIVKAKPLPPTTVTVAQPETTNATKTEESNSGLPTGAFVFATSLLAKGWYIIVALVGLGLLIKFYPRGTRIKGSAHKVDDYLPVHDMHKEDDYVEMKAGPVKEVITKKAQKIEKRADPKLDEARKKLIEEIRSRAMKEQKKR